MNLARGGALGDVQHHQQLNQMITNWRRQRLHNVDDAPAHARAQLHKEIVVAKARKVRLIQRHAGIVGNFLRQWAVGIAAEKADLIGIEQSFNCHAGLVDSVFRMTCYVHGLRIRRLCAMPNSLLCGVYHKLKRYGSYAMLWSEVSHMGFIGSRYDILW